ncbi:MAG: slipin family protein [Acidimicrobiales bacterium]|nr:slipin family protein [Acidimicrobiales bacterium]
MPGPNWRCTIGILIVVALLIGLILLVNSLKIVQEYERGVIFRLGRCVGAKGPGIFFVFPIIDKIVKVNLQEVAVAVSPQQVITRDNVTLKLDAVAFLRVIDPVAAVVKIRNWYEASALVAQTTLRAVIGHHDLDELLTNRETIDLQLKSALDNQTEEWGIEVRRVELRDIDLPEQIQRAMGRQAEAERDRRAKIISATGELQASEKLAEAARLMASPGAMQLRTLQTMAEISTEQNSTIIFPIPTEVMDAFRAFTYANAPQLVSPRVDSSSGGSYAPIASGPPVMPGIDDLPGADPGPPVEVPPAPPIPPASDLGTPPPPPPPPSPPPTTF